MSNQSPWQSDASTNSDLNRMRDQIAPMLRSGGGRSTSDDMDRIGSLETRMKGVETAIDGLRHSQNLTLVVLGLAVTIGIFGGGYLLTRMDALSSEVGALPDRINANLLELNRTLSESITAARTTEERQPTVIVIPSTVGTSPEALPE